MVWCAGRMWRMVWCWFPTVSRASGGSRSRPRSLASARKRLTPRSPRSTEPRPFTTTSQRSDSRSRYTPAARLIGWARDQACLEPIRAAQGQLRNSGSPPWERQSRTPGTTRAAMSSGGQRLRSASPCASRWHPQQTTSQLQRKTDDPEETNAEVVQTQASQLRTRRSNGSGLAAAPPAFRVDGISATRALLIR